MYVKKLVYKQVIRLFVEAPEYRDKRVDTIAHIVQTHYTRYYGVTVETDFRILSDIDRAFRLVQQHVPELRGLKWLERQRKGGEIDNGGQLALEEEMVRDACNQLQLKFV